MRAAAVGGAAYYAGKKVQEGRDEEALDNELEAAQEPADGAITDAQIEQLKKLSDLKTAGVLTEDEFETQKQKILGA